MRKHLLALGLCGAVAAGGVVVPGSSALAAQPGGEPAVTSVDSLRLEARSITEQTQVGKTATIEATATNTGNATLEYMLPTPCDSPFQVTVHQGSGLPDLTLRKEGVGRFCAQVVVTHTLRLGESVTDRFPWDTGAAKAAPGSYSIQVTFSAGNLSDAPLPTATVDLPVEVSGPADVMGHWAKESILAALRLGFVEGDPGGAFRPDSRVTRAEFIKMVVKAAGLQPKQSASPSFTDVAGHWVETQGYLEAAVEAGFVRPEEYSNVLSPDEPIDRQEIAWISVRAMAQERAAESAGPEAVSFTDRSEIAPWAVGYVVVAQAQGILKGYEDNSFRPTRTATRAEAVTMIHRVLQATAVKLDTAGTLELNGTPGGTYAVMERYDRPLAPLPDLEQGLGIRSDSAGDGWIRLIRGDARVRVKAGVPYGFCEGGCAFGIAGKFPLDTSVPATLDGELYLPEPVLKALGLFTRWDMAGRIFLVAGQ